MGIEDTVRRVVMAMEEEAVMFGELCCPHAMVIILQCLMAGIEAIKKSLTTRWYDHMALDRKVHRGVRPMQAHETLDQRRCV